MIKTKIAPDPITGIEREATMENLTIKSDLNIVLNISTVKLDANGQSLYEKVQNMPVSETFTAKQKAAALDEYHPKNLAPFDTTTSRINSQTGEFDANGDITELQFLQSITIGQVKAMFAMDDNSSYLAALYKFIEKRIKDVT